MKTTQKLSLLQIVFSLLCGAVFAVFRMKTPFSWHYWLIAAAAALLLCLFTLGVERFRRKQSLKPAVPDRITYSLILLSGLFWLIAGVVTLFSDYSYIMRLLLALFQTACGIVTVLRLMDRESGERTSIFAIIPIFYLCFYLLIFYRYNGDNSYLETFGCETAVLLLVLIGLYCTVAGRFEARKPAFYEIGMCWALAAIMQELLFCLFREARLSIHAFLNSMPVMLIACAMLLCSGLLTPAKMLQESPASEEEQ